MPEAAASTAVSVHLTLRVGEHTKEFDAVAATDADPYKVVDGLVGAIREDARDWAHDHQSQ